MAEKQNNVPGHVAIIMDGNRRWARSRGLPEVKGHQEGAETLEKIVEAAAKMGVKTLTVYALSTENLKERAKRELSGLFDLMKWGYRNKTKKMMQNGVRISVLGDISGLPRTLQKIIEKVRNTYIKNEAITLNIALNYGGRKELVDAFKEIIKEGISLDKIDEAEIDKHVYTKGQVYPDLIIRTGGVVRLSNFLLWQSGYAELYFTTKLWPDFTPEDLKKAIIWYQKQKRNFGK